MVLSQSFKSPPASVLKVLQGLRIALADPGDLPAPADLEWRAIRNYMHDTRAFLSDIVLLGPREARHPNKAIAMEPFFSDPDFQIKNVQKVTCWCLFQCNECLCLFCLPAHARTRFLACLARIRRSCCP